MAMSLLLAQRVLVMFALAGVGFAMFRAGKITLEGNRTIGNILIYLSLPAVIIKSLMVGRTVENAVALAEGAGVALVLIVVAALVARLTCRRDGITVLIITHTSALAPMADRLIRFKSGRVVDVGVNESPRPTSEIEW